MSRQRRVRFPSIIRFSCTVMIVTEWDHDEDYPQHTTVDLYEHISTQEGLRARVKVAWKVLRGRSPYTHGLILNTSDAFKLGEFLLAGPTGEGT